MVPRGVAAHGGLRPHGGSGGLCLPGPRPCRPGASVPRGRERPEGVYGADVPGVGLCDAPASRAEQAGADAAGHGGLCRGAGDRALPCPAGDPRRPHQAPGVCRGGPFRAGQPGAGVPGGLPEPAQRQGEGPGLVALGHHRRPGRGAGRHPGQRQGDLALWLETTRKRGGLVSALGVRP